MLSGMTQDYYIQKGFKDIADAYMTKPFNPIALLDKVADLLGEKKEPNGRKGQSRSG